jgi:hypothetical protein
MSMGAPNLNPSYDFRIIENYEAHRFELQTKKFIGWKTIATGDSIPRLEEKAKAYRRGYRVIKEFN